MTPDGYRNAMAQALGGQVWQPWRDCGFWNAGASIKKGGLIDKAFHVPPGDLVGPKAIRAMSAAPWSSLIARVSLTMQHAGPTPMRRYRWRFNSQAPP